MDLGSLVNRAIYSRKYQQENPPSQAYNRGLASGGRDAFTQIPRFIADLYAKGGGVPDPNSELPQVQQQYLERKAMQEAMKQKLMQDPNFAQGYGAGETLGGFVDPVGNLLGGTASAGIIAAGRNVLRAARGMRGYSPLANDAGVFVLRQNPEKKLTGQFSDLADKLPKQEISDYNAYVDTSKIAKILPYGKKMARTKLGDILEHKDLYKQYPELKDIEVVIRTDKSKFGGGDATYYPGDNRIVVHDYNARLRYGDLDKVILHELQHGLQDKFKFASGGNSRKYGDKYKYLAGEEEARRVESRMDMRPKERQGAPYLRSDIRDPKKLIPVFDWDAPVSK